MKLLFNFDTFMRFSYFKWTKLLLEIVFFSVRFKMIFFQLTYSRTMNIISGNYVLMKLIKQ